MVQVTSRTPRYVTLVSLTVSDDTIELILAKVVIDRPSSSIEGVREAIVDARYTARVLHTAIVSPHTLNLKPLDLLKGNSDIADHRTKQGGSTVDFAEPKRL